MNCAWEPRSEPGRVDLHNLARRVAALERDVDDLVGRIGDILAEIRDLLRRGVEEGVMPPTD